MVENLIQSFMSTPITPDTKYLLVVVMFIICFGIESLVELFGIVSKGARRL